MKMSPACKLCNAVGGCNCMAISNSYARLRAAIDAFAEETGHGLKLVIRPPRGSEWPRIEMTIDAKKAS